MTGAERQARLRARREAAGLRQVNLFVPEHAIADIQLAAALIAEAGLRGQRLSVGRLVDQATGRMRGLKRGLKTGENGDD